MSDIEVTPEMIKAGEAAASGVRSSAEAVRAVYLAMRALEPRVRELAMSMALDERRHHHDAADLLPLARQIEAYLRGDQVARP
jgi:hypothetical protein